jgi:hypothetical protein
MGNGLTRAGLTIRQTRQRAYEDKGAYESQNEEKGAYENQK